MYSDATVAAALARAQAGASQAAIARELGVGRTTVRGWLHARPTAADGRGERRRGRECDGSCVAPEALDAASYAYLLGQYLGDGCISAVKLSFRLRLSCCDDYPGIMDECERAICAVRPGAAVRRCQRAGCVEVSDSWRHWPRLLPHGEGGVKHRRVVTLHDWQRSLALDQQPGAFVRGLVHSDGWRGVNRVRSARGVRYEYPRYMFSNSSAEIRQLLIDACARLGVETRVMNAWTISVAKRASVARLDEVVGPKY